MLNKFFVALAHTPPSRFIAFVVTSQEVRIALRRTLFWGVIWVGVLYLAALFDGLVPALIAAFGEKNSSLIGDIRAIDLSASAVAYSYIGSVGAESAIRAHDDKITNDGTTKITQSRLWKFLWLSLAVALASAFAEMVGKAYEYQYLYFSAEKLVDIFSDQKFLIIFGVCSLLRVLIYYRVQADIVPQAKLSS